MAKRIAKAKKIQEKAIAKAKAKAEAEQEKKAGKKTKPKKTNGSSAQSVRLTFRGATGKHSRLSSRIDPSA